MCGVIPQTSTRTPAYLQGFRTVELVLGPVAHAYYWHRFYAHQPDLNYDSPRCNAPSFRCWIFGSAWGGWLRLDAVPYLYERDGTSCENLPETHAFLKELRRRVDAKFANRVFLAEANQWPEDAAVYFGEGMSVT